tara:strand:+ start:1732 stop:2976 length:1245 start_codon:yes stop_codon:yes gene_type:complete
MKISFIIPSRNNKKYLEWAYNSIRKNQGNHEVEICVADDFSEDGTKEWCKQITAKDPQFKWIRNEGPERQGLVILNDKLINEVATNDLCIVYHADMYLCPGALGAIEKHMYEKVNLVSGKDGYIEREKTIVSLTRIEPPLHPDGPEKCIWDCGIEPEEFDEDKLLKFIKGEDQVFKFPEGHTTEGVFAPWAFWKKDFQEIGGHDKLFAPQSKEDSDIFNRFHLNGIKFVQTWNGFVYHMTSRGSRFNPYSGGAPGQNSQEWIGTTTRNTKDFIRKWGHMIKHDQYMKPIVPPKYEIGVVVENCTPQLLEALEPWCSYIYVDMEEFVVYSMKEQENSSFNIDERVKGFDPNKHVIKDNITIKVDGNTFGNEEYRHIQNFSAIIQDNEEIGEFELGNLKIQINDLTTYENDLIICD